MVRKVNIPQTSLRDYEGCRAFPTLNGTVQQMFFDGTLAQLICHRRQSLTITYTFNTNPAVQIRKTDYNEKPILETRKPLRCSEVKQPRNQ